MVVAYSNKDEQHKKEITNLIEQYKIGGLMFLQGGPIRQAKLTNYFQDKSETPLMIAIDAEWGVAMRLDSSFRFPWNMTLGAIQDSNLIYQMGKEVARQCKLLGIHNNFAPVIDVNSNPKNPIINNRSFGEDPDNVASFGIAFMNGMQDNNVLACAKHFPGHGDTDRDSHLELPYVNRDINSLENIELNPFIEAINHGLEVIMTAHVIYSAWDKALPATFSPLVIKNILREKLGFDGLVITDDLEMKAVEKHIPFGSISRLGSAAGVDLYLICQDCEKILALQDQMIRDIEEGYIDIESVKLSVQKIIDIKKRIAISPHSKQNLTELVQGHLNLIEEMHSYSL